MYKVSDIREMFDKDKDDVVLIVVPAARYAQVNQDILSYLCNEMNYMCIYATVNMPYKVIAKTLSSKKINTDNIFFVDAVSGVSVKNDAKNCIFINSPQSLTEISIAMSQAVNGIKERQKFVFLDSITTLMMYNSHTSVARFAHFLASKIREWNIKGFMITMQKETDEQFISELTQFCDKVVML